MANSLLDRHQYIPSHAGENRVEDGTPLAQLSLQYEFYQSLTFEYAQCMMEDIRFVLKMQNPIISSIEVRSSDRIPQGKALQVMRKKYQGIFINGQ